MNTETKKSGVGLKARLNRKEGGKCLAARAPTNADYFGRQRGLRLREGVEKGD